MQVLIIGGTGFIGRRVVLSLVGAGHKVTVFHRGQTQTDIPNGDHICGDRKDLRSFAAQFKKLAPDVTLDMICYCEQEAKDLVNALDFATPRLVVASSMDVYRSYGRLLGLEDGPPDVPPFDEDSPLRIVEYPHRAIASSPRDFAMYYEKLHVERVVRASRLQATILRLPAVYGPSDKYHRTFEYLKRMDDGRTKVLLEDTRSRWRWTRGYVENVADAIALAVTDERSASRVYNVGEPDALTEAGWVRAIGEAAGWRGDILTLPLKKMPEHLRTPYNYQHQLECDTSRIRTELGYVERVPRTEAMKRTVEWERTHPQTQFDPSAFDYGAEDAALANPG